MNKEYISPLLYDFNLITENISDIDTIELDNILDVVSIFVNKLAKEKSMRNG